MKLTQRRIEQITVEAGRRDRLVFDNEQRGLAVRATTGGGRSYLVQYTLHRMKWRVPLGACTALTLARARKAAAAVMGEVAKGNNPAADRKREAAEAIAQRNADKLTLRTLLDDWKKLHLAQRRPRYASEAVRALHRAFATHLDRPADKLDRASVVRAIDAMHGNAIAGRTAAYGRAAFAWAIKRGSLHSNPFASLPPTTNGEARDRVLSDAELGEIWRAVDSVMQPYADIVRVLMLTGQRKGEVSGMVWSELNADLSEWILPAARTKNGLPHVVPLSEPARAILPSQRGEPDALVLPGIRATAFGGWSKAKRALDRAIIAARNVEAAKIGKVVQPLTPWRLHDLRRTVATGLQRLGVRLEVTEAVLNHASGSRSGIVGVYQRHTWADEKRAALDAWAAHVIAAVENRQPSATVIRLRG